MATKITVNADRLKVISGNDCKIGSFYRRQSEPNKVYICSRDTARDRRVGLDLFHGRMLVSLAHGNRMTSNMDQKDFIEVEGELSFVDALS